jgi:hypothetical protein
MRNVSGSSCKNLPLNIEPEVKELFCLILIFFPVYRFGAIDRDLRVCGASEEGEGASIRIQLLQRSNLSNTAVLRIA